MMPKNQRSRCRTAFTLVEVAVAFAVVAVVGIIIAQAVAISLRERTRTISRQAALELSANVLESARTEPFAKLDADWAKTQGVPAGMKELLPAGNLVVIVSPDVKAPDAKVVTVEVRWQEVDGQLPRSVRVATVVGPREAKSAGGTP